MSDKNNSGNLSKGDVISFVALLLMGILVFFGMNFMTLGDKIPSIVVAILTVILMTVFVFLAAYAKAQDYDQSKWKKVEYAMVGLYIISLVPCYFFSAKFFDIQIGKDNVMKVMESDVRDVNKIFSDYISKSQSRASSYKIELEALMTTIEGRKQIADYLEINLSDVNSDILENAHDSFLEQLTDKEFQSLEKEKNNVIKNSQDNFSNWNIMFIPQYAHELGNIKNKYTAELERIYDNAHNPVEKNIPSLDTEAFTKESALIDLFKSTDRFSVVGLIVVIFLGLMGLVKYLLGEKSSIVPIEKGNASNIEMGGGLRYKN